MGPGLHRRDGRRARRRTVLQRYRARPCTRTGPRRCPGSRGYLDHCVRHEQQCLAAARWGKRWTTRSCEKMFASAGLTVFSTGPVGPGGNSAPLYDAVKDLTATRHRRCGWPECQCGTPSTEPSSVTRSTAKSSWTRSSRCISPAAHQHRYLTACTAWSSLSRTATRSGHCVRRSRWLR
ncbi:DUF7255 family protein [Nocardia salmonicida]|uniref:DUF7255 family protein n=1 Tax=Nocardia salmonicida TaxID=53431 RepID=UPI00403B2B1F